jgi:LPS O-antigen subunit length determinant protein (WzzB/FepE family)
MMDVDAHAEEISQSYMEKLESTAPATREWLESGYCKSKKLGSS